MDLGLGHQWLGWYSLERMDGRAPLGQRGRCSPKHLDDNVVEPPPLIENSSLVLDN